MKYSQFNSLIYYQDSFALYNSFNDKVIFLVPELKDFLEAAKAEGIDKLNEYHPSFYEYLIAQNFLVDESIDEVQEVKSISQFIDDNENEFLLTINPTMNCNFKCWYCYETHIKDSKIENENISKIKKLIDQITSDSKIKIIYLSFFGGEPLLYFDKIITAIIDYYWKKCLENKINTSIGFTTNGFLINQKFIDYFSKGKDPCFMQITLDGYREVHDSVRQVSPTRGSYDKIVQNILLLVENNFNVRVRINYTDQNILNMKEIIKDFISIPKNTKNNNLVFDFHRVWQNVSGEDINNELDEVMQEFAAAGFQVDCQLSPNNVQGSCYADKRNSVTVNYNGDIYKCTARDFTKQNRAGVLGEQGELLWENDSLEKRMDSKFKNKPCHTCRLLPICNGGCSQVALENDGVEYCVYNGDEREKDNIVRHKILEIKRRYEKEIS